MNDEQYDYWQGYIRWMAGLFGLKDWRIELSRQYTKSDDASASCEVWENQKGATIYLSDWFMKQYDAVEQREVVFHELFHCHDYRIRKLVEEYLSADEETEKAKFFLNLFRREYEQLCDGVAVAAALMYPLPENRPDPLPSTVNP